MKKLSQLSLAFALGAGLGAAFFSAAANASSHSSPESEDAAAEDASATSGPAAELAELRASIARSAAEVQRIAAEFELLRSNATRTAVADSPDPVANASSPARERIRAVLDAELDARAKAAARAQRETERARAERVAARAAKKLALGANDAAKLADFYVSAAERRRELMNALRDPGVDRASRRESLQAYASWRRGELEQTFGAELAGALEALDRPQAARSRGNAGARRGASTEVSPVSPPQAKSKRP